MTNIKTKLAGYLLICLLIPTFQLRIFSQKNYLYSANLLIKQGASVESKEVLVAQENGTLKITGTKDRSIFKSFLHTSIKNADYAYSEKPQIKEAVIVGLLTTGSLLALPFLFNKTKRHWLVLNTEAETVVLELRQETYRRLLFEMNSNGIKITDLGNRDSKEEPLPHPQPDINFVEGESCGDEM